MDLLAHRAPVVAGRPDVGQDPLDHYLGVLEIEDTTRTGYESISRNYIRPLLGRLAQSRWADERAASMRYIARALMQKGCRAQAARWLLRAIAEAPYLREPYLDMALLLYRRADWPGVLYFTAQALKIRQRPKSYICEAAPWGALPHDLRAIAWHRLGSLSAALAEAEAALEGQLWA